MTIANLFVKVGADLRDLDSKLSKARKLVRDFSKDAASVGRKLTVGLSLPIALLGASSVSAAAQMDSLERGLTAVAGSSQAAQHQLEDLRAVARLPGLGFREAIEGSINLQAAGLSAELAESALMGFGNALATVGRGKADLQGVIMALGQIASKGKISAEEINQIAERVPQIRKVMERAFGTANSELLQGMGIGAMEFIRKVTVQLNQLKRVSGGVQNSFENLSDASFRARAAIGKQLVPALLPLVDGLAAAAEAAEKLNPETVRMALAVAAVAGAIGPLLIAIGLLVPAVISLSAAIGVGILPLIAVGGPVILALGALAAMFVKNKLDAAAAAGAFDKAKKSLESFQGVARKPEAVLADFQKEFSALAATQATIDELQRKRDAAVQKMKAAPQGKSGGLNARAAAEVAGIDRRIAGLQRTLELHRAAVRGLRKEYGAAAKAAEAAAAAGAGSARKAAGALAPTLDNLSRVRQAITDANEDLTKLRFDLAFASGTEEAEKLRKKIEELTAELGRLTAARDRMGGTLLAAAPTPTAGVVSGGSPGPLRPDTGTAARLPTRAQIAFAALQEEAARIEQRMQRFGQAFGQLTDAEKSVLRTVAERKRTVSDSLAAGTAPKTDDGGVLGTLKKGVLSVVTALNPLGILGRILSGALEELGRNLGPVIEVIASALIPILKALFPVFKLVAIAATYIGQVFFKVTGWTLKAIGALIKGIGDFINWILPGNPANGLVKAGRALTNLGQGFSESADALGKARDDIRKIEWKDAADDAKAAAAAMRNVPSGFKVALARFQATEGRQAAGAAASSGAGSQASAPASLTINGGLHLHGVQDVEGLRRELDRVRRDDSSRGGTTGFQVAASPAA